MSSDLENRFIATWGNLCVLNGISPVMPEREFRFCDHRRWRLDFAWPSHKVAVELEGGVWSRGRHSRGSGMKGDMDKYNTAAIYGWVVLRFSGDHLTKDPQGVFETICGALNLQRTKGNQ